MAELQLWFAFLDRDDVQALDAADRMALISIATSVADNLPDQDGFLPRGGLRRVPWGDGPTDLRSRIKLLVDLRFLQPQSDPEGWLLVGWLDRTGRYRSGDSDSDPVRWGQRSSKFWKKHAERNRLRQAKFRDQQRSENTSP